ncbi:diacylglycerol kinase family protein [uncultured Friedmanniella sp.]|uniref:diacylglycerol kinase family protein n=1 Tax=uncultured Friedmanniella sp. TaxID=335381 RepID=UPI0035C9D7DF
MPRRRPRPAALVIASVLLAALAVWTWLTFTWAPLQTYDRRALPAPVDPLSAEAQIAGAFALVTWPAVDYVALLAVAAWASRRRLRQLSVALVLMVVLGWGGATLLKVLLGRDRPAQALGLVTANGYSYPSGHLVAVTVLAIGVGATFAVSRRSVRARLLWQTGSVLVLIAVALDRWLLGAHYVTDIVGGLLLGGLAAVLSLIVAGVRLPVPHDLVTELVRGRSGHDADGATPRRAAVIFNPAKVVDWVTFRRQVEYELAERGWAPPLWLETSVNDPGRSLARQAVAEGVDLVLGAGGDGTIRVICSGLAGTGVPFGLIPSGTGNLLARNIGIPLDRGAALDVALDGVDKAVDLVEIRVDGGEPDHCAVMGGIGIDAVIMDGTNADLKKAVGSAAYFVSAAQNANHPALHTTITVDDQPPLRRRAHVILVGNVGYLQANIPLIPDAKYDDGLLDVMIASPRTAADWVRITTRVLTRQRRGDEQLDRLTGRKVTITVEERDSYQLDGDTVGECGTMVAEVLPGALTLRVPRTLSASREQPADALEQSAADAIAGVENR